MKIYSQGTAVYLMAVLSTSTSAQYSIDLPTPTSFASTIDIGIHSDMIVRNLRLQEKPSVARPTYGIAQLNYSAATQLSRTVQSEFLARVKQSNPSAAQQVAAQFAQYNPSEIFARFAKAAGVPFRDPSSSMAIYTVIGWGIVNDKYPDPNNATDMARVRAVRAQMIPLIASQAAMAKPEMRQRLDEELMILTVLLDAANTSASTREGADARAKLSDGVHALWLKQFGKDLRKLALTDQGLVKK